MTRLLISLLPMAVGIAFSPIPIIAVILMLFSKRAKVNAPLFAATWVGAMLIVGGVALFFLADNEFTRQQSVKIGGSTAVLLLGVLFVLYGVVLWLRRPRNAENAKTPRWLQMVSDLPPFVAAALGMASILLNTKNLPLFLAAVQDIVTSDLGLVASFVALVIFVVMASVTVVTPIVLFLFGGETMHARLAAFRVWLTHYNQAILAWVFLMMGGVMVLNNSAALLGY